MILIIMTSENILKTKNEIVDLRDIIFLIWRKKFIFLIITIFFLILGFWNNYINPPSYKIEIDINRIPFSSLTEYSNLNLSGANKFLEEVIDYSKENIGNISHNHILGYESIKRLEGNQSSNKFINKLTSAEINDISQIQWIIDYVKDEKLPESKNFDLINKILNLK